MKQSFEKYEKGSLLVVKYEELKMHKHTKHLQSILLPYLMCNLLNASRLSILNGDVLGISRVTSMHKRTASPNNNITPSSTHV